MTRWTRMFGCVRVAYMMPENAKWNELQHLDSVMRAYSDWGCSREGGGRFSVIGPRHRDEAREALLFSFHDGSFSGVMMIVSEDVQDTVDQQAMDLAGVLAKPLNVIILVLVSIFLLKGEGKGRRGHG